VSGQVREVRVGDMTELTRRRGFMLVAECQRVSTLSITTRREALCGQFRCMMPATFVSAEVLLIPCESGVAARPS
jgi:hypothetical protein